MVLCRELDDDLPATELLNALPDGNGVGTLPGGAASTLPAKVPRNARRSIATPFWPCQLGRTGQDGQRDDLTPADDCGKLRFACGLSAALASSVTPLLNLEPTERPTAHVGRRRAFAT